MNDQPPLLSVIVPNHNGAATIGACLEALLASRGDNLTFEVIVVDDGSSDDSPAIIKGYPCRLVTLPRQLGASAARNAGAAVANGPWLFFIDADCLVNPDTLAVVAAIARRNHPATVIGGTYTLIPADRRFFSRFQSAFINHFETKRLADPDYVATHAMLIHRATFQQSGGLPEFFLPIIEDVAFSHQLRRQGCELRMEPTILVRHHFNYGLGRSLHNAFRKARYWTIYSLNCRDLFHDSGTASHELKLNGLAFAAAWLLIAGWLLVALLGATGQEPPAPACHPAWPAALLLLLGGNLWLQRRLLATFRQAGGRLFAVAAAAYYTLLYPLPINLGGLVGVAQYYLGRRPGLPAAENRPA